MVFNAIAKALLLITLASEPTSQPNPTGPVAFNRTVEQILQGTGLRKTRGSGPGVVIAGGVLQNTYVSVDICGDSNAPVLVNVTCEAPLENKRKDYELMLKVVTNVFPDWGGCRSFFDANAELVSSHKVESVVAHVRGGDVELQWMDKIAEFLVTMTPKRIEAVPAK